MVDHVTPLTTIDLHIIYGLPWHVVSEREPLLANILRQEGRPAEQEEGHEIIRSFSCNGSFFHCLRSRKLLVSYQLPILHMNVKEELYLGIFRCFHPSFDIHQRLAIMFYGQVEYS